MLTDKYQSLVDMANQLGISGLIFAKSKLKLCETFCQKIPRELSHSAAARGRLRKIAG